MADATPLCSLNKTWEAAVVVAAAAAECDDPCPARIGHLLLISDKDGQRWVNFSEDLESLACCCRTLL